MSNSQALRRRRARIVDERLGESDRFLLMLDGRAVVAARRQRQGVTHQQVGPGTGQGVGRAAFQHHLKMLLGADEIGQLHQDLRQDQMPLDLGRFDRHGRLRRLQGRVEVARLTVDAVPSWLGPGADCGSSSIAMFASARQCA